MGVIYITLYQVWSWPDFLGFCGWKIGFNWKRGCCTEKKSQVLWGLWDAVWSVQWCRWWTRNKCCFYPVWNDLNDARNARPISKPSSQSTESHFWLWILISSAYRNLAILMFLKWSVLTMISIKIFALRRSFNAISVFSFRHPMFPFFLEYSLLPHSNPIHLSLFPLLCHFPVCAVANLFLVK